MKQEKQINGEITFKVTTDNDGIHVAYDSKIDDKDAAVILFMWMCDGLGISEDAMMEAFEMVRKKQEGE
jgi:hypothetical protein